MDQNTARQQYEQGIALQAAGVPEALVKLLNHAQYEAGRAAEVLQAAVASVTNRCERITHLVDDGRHVNELGELQSSALSVDVACGRYEMANAHLKMVKDAVIETLVPVLEAATGDAKFAVSKLVCEL